MPVLRHTKRPPAPRRRPNRRLSSARQRPVFAAALALTATLAACGDTIGDRTDVAESLAQARFGEDNRQAVEILPGVVLSAEVGDDETALQVRATGPYPTVNVDNGTVVAGRVTLELQNGDPDAVFVPTLAPLTEDGRKDPDCDAAEFDGLSEVVLAPVSPASEGTTLTFELDIPRCSRMQLVAQPAADTDAVHIAILGAVQGDARFLGNLLADMATDLPDHVHVLGNMGGTRAALTDTLAELEATGVPYSVSLGQQDVRADLYTELLGPGDYLTQIGHVRFLNIDSANNLVSSPQVTLVSGLDTGTPPGIAVTYAAPMAVGASPGWRSAQLAGRMIGALDAAGFDHIFAGAGARASAREFGGLQLTDLGAGDGAGDTDRVAWVTITRPWSVLTPCDTNADCDGDGGGVERCEAGFCRTECTADSDCAGACPLDSDCGCFQARCGVLCTESADCPGASPECVSSQCVLDPVISVTLRDRE